MMSSQPEYSSEFVYIPPINVNETQAEWGSSQRVRFLVPDNNQDEPPIRCLDCEATSHWSDLQSLDLSKPGIDLIQAMKKMQNTLLWILENSNWGCA